MVAANSGAYPAYGNDPHSAAAEQALRKTFGCDLDAFLVVSGTAANALALGAMTPPWGAVFCHEHAHIMEDECGAPELFTAGAKILGVEGNAGKIDPDALRARIARMPRGTVKQVQPAVLSLSQATECGTLYSLDEIRVLSDIAHGAGLSLHMDGARFVNAMLTLGCTPAQMSWQVGVDVLSFGATKNGTLACEAIMFFRRDLAKDFVFQRKRGGHTVSKGRLLGSQMVAYLADDHWLELGAHANVQADALARGLAAIPGVRLMWPREANEVFVVMPGQADAALKAAGAHYYSWRRVGMPLTDEPRADEAFVRLVTSFSTDPAEVTKVVAIVAAATKA